MQEKEKSVRERLEKLEGRVDEQTLKREEFFFLSKKHELDSGEMYDMIKSIKLAVVGDEEMGHTGLVKRVEENEREIKTLKAALNEEIQKLKDIIKDFKVLFAKAAAFGGIVGSGITIGIGWLIKLFS